MVLFVVYRVWHDLWLLLPRYGNATIEFHVFIVDIDDRTYNRLLDGEMVDGGGHGRGRFSCSCYFDPF